MIGKFCTLAALSCSLAFAQSTATPATSATPAAETTAARTYAFEVVSIRRNLAPLAAAETMYDGPTADGYRSHWPLARVLFTAFSPQVGGAAAYAFSQIKGAPDWIMTERYDVDARIAEADREQWQNPTAQKIMLQSMLQSLLADRCKLVVHREVKETSVPTLVLTRDGPKFKPTGPAADHPDGVKLPFGGVEVLHGINGTSFYDISMASFVSFLGAFTDGQPVQDKTGLAGRYDIELKFAPEESQLPLSEMIASGLNGLGLKLETQKGQVETLIIDHVERPSAN